MTEPRLTWEQRRMLGRAQQAAPSAEQLRAMQALTERVVGQDFVPRVIAALEPMIATVARAAEQMVASIDFDALRDVIRRIGEVARSLLPPALRDLDMERWGELTAIARDEQLCLAWVPDHEMVTALLDAGSAVERDDLLVASAGQVLAACDLVLDLAAMSLDDEEPDETSPLPEVVALLRSGVAAARDGHFAAAQALATCVTDSLMTQHLTPGRTTKVHTFVKQALNREEESQLLAAITVDVLTTLQSTLHGNGTWAAGSTSAGAPRYSRHATVHAARADVFTDATALKAVLLAVSVLMLACHPFAFELLGLVEEDDQAEPRD